MDTLHRPVLDWYAVHARDLPWRGPGATPWAVMVSEFMLQQTPVARVLPVFESWMTTWPTPTALAAAPSGEAVRAWGRLGYPRRALRLHAAARAIVDQHDGEVPSGYDDLIALPGVGDYTASAIASFAFGARHPVLDTNVRRVLARLAAGQAHPEPTLSKDEVALAEGFVPATGPRAARWAVASMELGAVICTARRPRCDACPVQRSCCWRAAGYPVWTGPPRRAQPYAGTDRQCRGALLAVLRSSDEPVAQSELERAWPEADQRDRALATLVADGLATTSTDGWTLPT